MKFNPALVLPLAIVAMAGPVRRAETTGFDISSYQPNVDFSSAYSSGMRFVMIKATEGTNYISSTFSSQYTDATNAGFIRGGYHFADPSSSSGTAQADYFAKNGGGWTGDGKTLPGMLDLESGSSEGSSECWGLSASSMVDWIDDFVTEYHSKTTRYPIIYTSPSWWSDCTGNSEKFASTCPLDMACWDSSPCSTFGGWSSWTIWQNKDTNTYGGDSDIFNGDSTSLKNLATG